MRSRYTKAELASYAWEVRLDAVLLTRLATEQSEAKLVRQRAARVSAGVALRARTMLDRDTVGTFGRSDASMRQRSLTAELADGMTCPDVDLDLSIDAQTVLGDLAGILASGATQRESAELLGMSKSEVNRRILAARAILKNENKILEKTLGQNRPLPDVTCEG